MGETTITEQQVTDVTEKHNAFAEAFNKTQEGGQTLQLVDRQIVVQYLVSDELCQRMSREQGFSFAPPELPAEASEFLSLAYRFESCAQAIPVSGAPTDAEWNDLYQKLMATGQIPAEATLADVQGLEQVPQLMGMQKALAEKAAATDMVVNPRYRDLRVPVFNAQLAAVFGTRGPVIDAPRQPLAPPVQ